MSISSLFIIPYIRSEITYIRMASLCAQARTTRENEGMITEREYSGKQQKSNKGLEA